MRVLLLLRGAPGVGKSTWIDQNGLRKYALSADEIREMCEAPIMNADGKFEIGMHNDQFVWKTLYDILEKRMKHGDFTVIDATNSKTTEMNKYKALCQDYRYRMFCVDFTSVPIEVCKQRNAQRPEVKRVPEDAIDKMYARFETQKIPAGITVISPDELHKVWRRKLDMSEYKKMHIIGDIHGCHTALMEYFKDGIKDDELYLFTGDFIDRGIENAEVVKFLLSIYTKPNVELLEGNHERWLWKWANDEVTQSKEFEFVTKRQLDDAEIDKREVRKLYRKLGQCAWFTFGGKDYFVCHGGISKLPENLTLVSTEQLIKGVGTYGEFEKVEQAFEKNTPDCIMIHGHRNTKLLPIVSSERTRNLEGAVEFGGALRIVQVAQDGSEEDIEIANHVFRERKTDEGADEEVNTVADLVMSMRKNKYISEKRFGNISSFNFTPAAFYDGAWSRQTMKARGLYINLDTLKIAARAYDKFFNINEREETKFDVLQHYLTFPVKAYVKENGFLGIVSYNESQDTLFVTTKSNPEGEYAGWFYDMLISKVSPEGLQKLKEYAKNYNVSFVFECVDMVHDPHVIDYSEDTLVLLDIVYNDIKFRKVLYDDMRCIAEAIGVQHKELAFQLGDWQEFYDWYMQVTADDYQYNGRNIEGFVIEDADGKMVKLKLAYYKFWKFMRSIAAETFKKGYVARTAALTTALANRFYGWCREIYQETKKDDIHAEYTGPRDICTLRKMFMKTEGEKA